MITVEQKKFIEYILFTCDFKQLYNSDSDYGFERNDVEDTKIYSLEDVYQYWIKNVKQ